jgi:hypothetical protein
MSAPAPEDLIAPFRGAALPEARGLPDLATARPVDDGVLYRPFDRFYGAELFLPQALTFATNGSRPWIALDVVRGSLLGRPPPYGLLNVRLAPPPAPEGTVGIVPRGCWATLRDLVGVAAGVADELAAATSWWVRWEEIELRWSLTYASATALGDALEQGVFAGVIGVGVSAPMVAPRDASIVTFDPRAVAEAVDATFAGGTTLAELASFLAAPAAATLFSSNRGALGPAAASALAPRLLTRLASADPVPDRDLRRWTWPAPSTVESGEYVWDLSRLEVVDPVPVMPVGTLSAAGPDGAGVQESVNVTEVPPQPSGWWRVVVTTTLPQERVGLEYLGVRLVCPAAPPRRPQPAEATAELGSSGTPELIVRLSPLDEQVGELSTFAMVRQGDRSVVLHGPVRKHRGPVAIIRPDDLPFPLRRMQLEPALAKEATVRVTAIQETPEGATPIEAHLDTLTPTVAIATPDPASTVLSVEATALEGDEVVRSQPLPAADHVIDRGLFAEFGAQRVEVSAAGLGTADTMTLEIASEQDLDQPTVLTLSGKAPLVEWRYATVSPFRAGYRYRLVEGGPEVSEWSSPRSPFEPLILSASTTGGNSA